MATPATPLTTEPLTTPLPMLLLSELKVKSESKYFGLAKCGTLQSESTSFKGAIGRLLLEQRGTTTRWTNVNGDIKIPSILLLLLPSLTQPPRSSGPAEKRQSISCRPTAGRNPLVTDTTILPVMNSYVF